MKICLLKAFDLACFRIFTPGPAGFINEETAKKFCEVRNADKNDVYYAYDIVDISEAKPEDITE
jgi:hypothetical protein